MFVLDGLPVQDDPDWRTGDARVMTMEGYDTVDCWLGDTTEMFESCRRMRDPDEVVATTDAGEVAGGHEHVPRLVLLDLMIRLCQ
jgi:hypothetical protein